MGHDIQEQSSAGLVLTRPTSHVPRPDVKVLRGRTIGIIGAGKMGQALIRGMVAAGCSPRALLATDADPLTRRRVMRQCRIQVTKENRELVCRSEIVILAVKPQQVPEVLEQIRSHLTPRHLVISIAAGLTLRWLQARLPRIAVVRVMPNLPATVRCGFSAIAWGTHARPSHRAMTREIFSAVGQIIELPERTFDAVTAVSGSGPAYVFFLVQMWEAAARSLGLSADVATAAIQQTLEGSAQLLKASRAPAAMLVGQVASKGGTTEAALKVLAKWRVGAHFVEALRAAARRSSALSH